MSKKSSKRKKQRRSTQELAPISEQRYARPAADEEEEPSIRPEGGVLRVDTGSLTIPEEIAAEAQNRKASGANRVVIVIATLMLAFIALIAWFISGQ
jgi:hypothetical protein